VWTQFVEFEEIQGVTSKQFQEAEDWAHNMFDQHFNNNQEGRRSRNSANIRRA
jgi:hypothetical protein